MSIKKLFDSEKLNDVLVSTNLEEEVVKNAPELESADNVREQIERINRFIPQVDYSDPGNFAVYGSARQYYADSVNRIISQYPYDGSEEEITRYNNESNYLDLHILENDYPRTNGIFRIDNRATATGGTNAFGNPTVKSHLTFFGGPNSIKGGMTTGSFHLQFTGSNYYDADIYQTDGTLALGRVGSRESNLAYNLPNKGVTVEFWLQGGTTALTQTDRIAFFDLWNGEPSSSAQYGRLTIYGSASVGSSELDAVYLNAYSGTVGIQELKIIDATATLADFNDGTTWKHYAFAMSSGSTGLSVKSYLNGSLTTTTSSTLALNEVTGALRARIGALLTNPSGTSIGTDMDGYGKTAKCGYDEFRYWKTERTEKEIQQNYWTQVRGGTNNEIANAELGVYYKFNEGITGEETTDATVLDYSGRITNGTILNYGTDTSDGLTATAHRTVGSAIVSASAATSEFKDPIIYASHPDVVALVDRLESSGSVHDFENQAAIIDTLPGWIVDEEDQSGNGELSRLTQILGSYMDTLNLQIQSLPDLANNTYLSGSDKPIPFMRNLLSSRGLAVPEIFVDADLLQRFANRSDTESYTLDINDTKNLIYKNIYNNLTYLYKSKGTEKAFRNLIRCYGIGEDVIRFNAYASNQTFDIQETRQDRVIRKNYVDFNHPDRFDGVVYQRANTGETSGISFFSASSPDSAFAQTAELEIIFPRKFEFANSQYFDTPFVTASIFGKASASADPAIFDASFSNNPASAPWLVAYAVRTQQNSNDAYFVLDSNLFTNPLTSDIYSNIYDNQKWNLAIRVKSKNWPYTTGSINSGDVSGDQEVSFVGYNVENGVVRNSFVLTTSSISSNLGPSLPYRYFIGSQRTNYTGTVDHQTDILASSLRVYTTFLDDDVIKSHALDPENYGTRNPSRNLLFYNDSDDASLNPAIKTTIPESVSLALNWDYSQVTGTDATGRFSVQDASSGSTGLTSRYPQENVLTNVNKQFAGRGQFGASAYSSTDVISKQFVQSAQQRLPEVVNSSDDVSVLSRDDELYPRDASISQTYYTFEKSMYGIVSQEMINMFSSIVEFNNLIGEVVHKYRGEYKSLRLLRELFFQKIENNPDLDKFIDYYKWIDSSLNIFLQQFVPASADVSDEIRTVVEDYVLNRSKYQHKYPQLDYKGNDRFGGDEAKLEGRVKGIRELEYNWQFGHAPITNSQTEHSTWWKERAERSNTAFDTPALIDTARQDILTIIQLFNSASADSLNDGAGASGVYEGSTYATRRFTRQSKLSVGVVPDIGGGYNYPRGHKPDGVFAVIPKSSVSSESLRVAKLATPDASSEELRPTIKQHKRSVPGVYSDNISNAGDDVAGTKYLTPFVAYSSSVSPADGFGQNWQSALGGAGTSGPDAETGMEFSGYHNDSYGDDYEVPMQGPFTNQHVGGNRHRHTDLNEGSDTRSTRPEAYGLFSPTNRTVFLAADSGLINGISTRPNYRRDETAKRPLNIKNVKHRTGSLGTVAMGNFDKRYEIVNTTGRTQNNAAFVKNEGFSTASVTTLPLGYFEGLIDYAKPVRRRTEHVIVSRFSAPGGPDTAADNQGGPGLDYEAAELSPYNNLNYRNTTVRTPLRTLLTEHSARFGLRSGSLPSALNYTDVTASFHKVNRNPLRRLKGYSNNEETPVTGAVFDNYFVQHMIPQSDFQYSWVTASTDRFNAALGAANNVYGYFPYDGLARESSSVGFRYVSAVNFQSASENGSGISTTRQIRQKNGSYDAGSFVPNNFVGMNTNIIDKFNVETQQMGFALTDDIKNYINYGDIGHLAVAVANNNSFIQNMTNNNATNAGALNGIIHYRNGPYNYPTWKQVRVGQSQLARHYRKSNLYTHTIDRLANQTDTLNDAGTSFKQSGDRTTLLTTQSVVSDRYYPVVYNLEIRNDQQNSKTLKSTDVVVRVPFVNDVVTFDNIEFKNNVVDERRLKQATARTSYKQIINNFSMYDGLLDEEQPILQINKLQYRETVYPPQDFAYTEKVRGRTGYENNFWRDTRADRTTKGESKKPTSSMGLAVNQSAWALDGFETTVIGAGFLNAITGGYVANNGANYKPGQLQNIYTQFAHTAPESNLRSGILYSRKHVMPFTGSVVGYGEKFRTVTAVGTAIGAIGAHVIAPASIGRGEAFWDAPTLAGKYEGTSSVFVKTEAKPFYDDYDKFFADIKPTAGGRSIIPEFRISEHIDFYDDNGGDFLTENTKFLSIAGTPANSSLPQNSSEENFFKIFTNSDFMKYFEVVRDDAGKEGGILKPDSIKLRCKAIKKFVPYDGFYPAERTIQIAQEFSASIGPNTFLTGTEDIAFRTILKPFFAPGIMYNTIKSGVAVDYPVMTGSVEFKNILNFSSAAQQTLASAGIFSNSSTASASGYGDQTAGEFISHNGAWDYRVPFESLLEPTKYIYGKNIIDDEPSSFCRIASTASWARNLSSKRYTNMVHNFLASSLEFFIKGGKPAEIVSAPQVDFKPVTPGQPYGLRIKMYRTYATDTVVATKGDWGDFKLPQYTSGSRSNFSMYNRPSAFGPPVVCATGAVDQTTIAMTGSFEASPAVGRYMSHTPPYYDGESWIDLIYYPYKSFDAGAGGLLADTNATRVIRIDDLHSLAITEFPSGSAMLAGSSNKNDSRIGGEGTYVVRWRFDQEALKGIQGSTYHNISLGSGVGPMGGPWANQWAMQLDASLNIFSKLINPEDTSALKNDTKWRIQTKFETPMLDFGYLTEDDITTYTGTAATSATNDLIPYGMWHQFGRIPKSDQGVYIQVTDIPTDFINNHPSASVAFDVGGMFDVSNAVKVDLAEGFPTTNTTERSNINKALTGYRLPQNMTIGTAASVESIKTTNAPLSLVDVCGFSTEPVRVGELPNIKKVFEAIVAVPFVEVEGERRFLKISGTDPRFGTTPAAVAKDSKSILRLEKMLNKYVFPPTFDFVNNEVDAVAMYVFEFAHKFTKNDLSHIWQNLPPKLGTIAEPALATVRHKLVKNELLDFSFGEVTEAVLDDKPVPDAELPQELQWMVFKVKQRAPGNYYKQIGSEQEAEIPLYTYNWPYDFFSMVELASIDAEVSFTPTKKNLLIKKKKRDAANVELSERLKGRERRPIDVNIGDDE